MRDDIQCLDFFLVLQQFYLLPQQEKKENCFKNLHTLYTPDFSGVISHNSHLLYNCDQSISKACKHCPLVVSPSKYDILYMYVAWNQVKFLLHVDMYIVQLALQTMHMLFETGARNQGCSNISFWRFALTLPPHNILYMYSTSYNVYTIWTLFSPPWASTSIWFRNRQQL